MNPQCNGVPVRPSTSVSSLARVVEAEIPSMATGDVEVLGNEGEADEDIFAESPSPGVSGGADNGAMAHDDPFGLVSGGEPIAVDPRKLGRTLTTPTAA